jgi:hypothetical protein
MTSPQEVSGNLYADGNSFYGWVFADLIGPGCALFRRLAGTFPKALTEGAPANAWQMKHGGNLAGHLLGPICPKLSNYCRS